MLNYNQCREFFCGVMGIVIYVDLLFVINFFVTFFLLLITSKISKKDYSVLRFILASALGGLYSLIILVDDMNELLLLGTKVAVCLLIVFAAFKFTRLKNYCFTVLLFLAANFIVLGVVVGAYFLFGSERITVHNSVIYFDIGARGIIISAFCAYVISCAAVRFYNRRLSSNELFTLVIENNGSSVTMFALSDTGNKLREPFSDSPVIVADESLCRPLVDKKRVRAIPTSTVNGGGILMAFKPDKIILKSSKGREVIENAYIALSDDIKDDKYSAVLNPEILSV